LVCEKNALNLQNIIWTICCFIYEEIEINNAVANQYLTEIFEIIKNNASSLKGEYSASLFNCIFEFLSSLIPLYKQLTIGDEVNFNF
jgi:hypothetical protein